MKIYDEVAKKETLLRLDNWALWSATGGYPDLNMPSFMEIMSEYFPSDWRDVAYDKDAMEIEETITSLDIAGRMWDGWGDVYRLILKQEYLERGRPLPLKTENVKRYFKFKSYSERSYERHWHEAKMCVFMLSDPISKK